ncbi:MAG: lipid kinase YegS [Verrucomicrobiota bacterium]
MKGKIRILLNGKKAGLKEVRDAISAVRQNYPDLEVRTTYESGDIQRLLCEASAEGVDRIIAGGGDGTINEVADALMNLPNESKTKASPEVGIFPLGTANDFARACQIPVNLTEALTLAVCGSSVVVDVGKANERYFMNVASGGFGAEITVDTPVELKNFLGGGAYTLTGLVKAVGFTPYAGTLTTEKGSVPGAMIVGAICNGRQAGGGQVLAPQAVINDGLLDVMMIADFAAENLAQVISEIKTLSPDGQFAKLIQEPWVEIASDGKIIPFNLDGEPYRAKNIRFEVVPSAIKFVLPESCPLLK